MKTAAIGISLLVASFAFLALAPAADAVGTCTFLDPRCPALACVGTSWSYPDPYYRCQYAIGDEWWPPCHPCPYPAILP